MPSVADKDGRIQANWAVTHSSAVSKAVRILHIVNLPVTVADALGKQRSDSDVGGLSDLALASIRSLGHAAFITPHASKVTPSARLSSD